MKQIFFKEWALLLTASVVLSLHLIIWVCKQDLGGNVFDANQHASPPLANILEIEVLGAVAFPGVYRCHPGATVGELLQEAHLNSRADRKKICMGRLLLESQRLEIPEKAKKRVPKGRSSKKR